MVRRAPALLVVLLLAPAARAQEKKVSLIFTGELLSQIATDNQGSSRGDRRSPHRPLPLDLDVRMQRASGRVSLMLTASGDDDLRVSFQFTLDKMVYYRMQTARADVDGMTASLQEAKAAEPHLRGSATATTGATRSST